MQQNCCRKVKDFIFFCNSRISWFLNDTDYSMCVKTAVEAVNTAPYWFSTDECKWWQQSCNGTMKGREGAGGGFCSWICRHQCSFQCWRWRLKMQRKLPFVLLGDILSQAHLGRSFCWGGLLILKEAQGGSRMAQGGMGSEGEGKRGQSQFIAVRCTTACLLLCSLVLTLSFAAAKLFSLYLTMKIINYLSNLSIFLLF